MLVMQLGGTNFISLIPWLLFWSSYLVWLSLDFESGLHKATLYKLVGLKKKKWIGGDHGDGDNSNYLTFSIAGILWTI